MKRYWIMWYGERLWATASTPKSALNYLRRRVCSAPYNCPRNLAAKLVDEVYAE